MRCRLQASVHLTALEARELWLVAGNGYGDGDYYTAYRSGANHAAFLRAMQKLSDARQDLGERQTAKELKARRKRAAQKEGNDESGD